MSENFYDLIVTGVAFINRFRKVQPEQGEAYYAVTLACLRGAPNGEGRVQKTYIDCNVCGDAIAMAKQLDAVFKGDQDPKVMVGFALGDLEQRAFQYKRGERKGQTGYALKGRLFDIKWFKVNGGETVYSPKETERRNAASDSAEKPQLDEPVLPNEVKLVQEDPYYEEREQQLLEQGYRYAGGGLWTLGGAAA